MRSFVMLVSYALACGPEPSDGTESASTSSRTTEASTALSVTTTDVATTSTSGEGLAEHGPCPQGDECSLCVQSEGASICGPPCSEYGPGPAPGRCPESAVQGQSICPWEDSVPGVCLIMCGDAADCPDPGMVCVTCPEPFTTACDGLWAFTETGPKICAWPST